MEVISLQSGSSGNCFCVRSGPVQLLIDAGISGNSAENRLAERGFEIRKTTALLITHDHRDHAQNMGVYHRKYRLPIFVTGKTFEAARRSCNLGRIEKVNWFVAGETLQFGHVQVHSIPTPHDGADGVAFVIDDGNRRVGVLSDLGHAFAGLREVLRSLDAVVIESNYDEEMLESGPYPPGLKARIRGPGGHLSNHDAAQLVREGAERLQWACLCHLSAENNSPELARETHAAFVGPHFPVHIAPRYDATDVLKVR
jgi:phosphoribosyl 1,2-cyclic phosphodiesterase